MECINHQDKQASAVCTNCGASICNDCCCKINNMIVCPSCFHSLSLNNLAVWKRERTTYLVYMFFALIAYICGYLVAVFAPGIWMVCGFIIMGLPNFVAFSNKRFIIVIVGSLTGIFIIKIVQIILGIIFTPIFIIKSLIGALRCSKEVKAWTNHVKGAVEQYPFIVR